jgi:hypothetical protein
MIILNLEISTNKCACKKLLSSTEAKILKNNGPIMVKKTVPAFAYKEATTPYYMNVDHASAKETWSYNSQTSMDERNYMQILLLNLHPWPLKYALSKSLVSGLQFLLSPCPPHASPIDSD